MEYRLVRSQRKSIAVLVHPDASVEVRAPARMPEREIAEFLYARGAWIAAAQARMEQAARNLPEPPQIGGTLPLLGIPCEIQAGERRGFSGGIFFVRPGKPCNAELEETLRELARGEFCRRAERFAPAVGVTPAGVGVTGARGRFGSCSAKNRLNFSWRLLLAPEDLVDYVVIHELCHIREHNHSARFWREVEKVMPDYREREKRLKEFGRREFRLLP